MRQFFLQKNYVEVHTQNLRSILAACEDKNEMEEMFYTISDGQYKDILYREFTKERVDKELKEFLDRDFFPRYGGGIGVTRMIRAMENSNLLE